MKHLMLLFFIGAIISNCAYRVGSGDREFPGGYKTVSVPIFKNDTHEVGTEVYFTNALVEEVARSRVVMLSQNGVSQTTLRGTVTSVEYLPTATIVGLNTSISGQPDGNKNGTKLNSEYRIVISVKAILERNSDQKKLWESSITKEMTYQTPRVGTESLNSMDATYNQSAHHRYIRILAKDMMVELYDRLTENF